jgi:hypothetical protein
MDRSAIPVGIYLHLYPWTGRSPTDPSSSVIDDLRNFHLPPIEVVRRWSVDAATKTHPNSSELGRAQPLIVDPLRTMHFAQELEYVAILSPHSDKIYGGQQAHLVRMSRRPGGVWESLEAAINHTRFFVFENSMSTKEARRRSQTKA